MTISLTAKPGPRRRSPTRPYAGQRNAPPSITTVIGVLGAPGLPWAAAKETALFAVHFGSQWENLPEDQAIDRLRKHHAGLWQGRAAMGTLIHAVNDAWTWGEEADTEAIIAGIVAGKRPPKIWQGREHEVAVEAEGYVDGLEQFWVDWRPQTIATEEVVRHPTKPNAYIGQRDWVAELDGRRVLIEIKTTAQQDEDKGLYAESWRLQLAAQRYADEIVHYDEAGNETGTSPNYTVDHCGVLHLRGDGRYSFYEAQAGGDEWARFCQCVGLWRWVNHESKTPHLTLRAAPSVEERVMAG